MGTSITVPALSRSRYTSHEVIERPCGMATWSYPSGLMTTISPPAAATAAPMPLVW